MAASALALAALAPGAAAQPLPDPHPPSESAFKDLSLSLGTTYVQIPYLGRVDIPMTLEDLSRDSYTQPGVPVGSTGGPRADQIEVSVSFEGGPQSGWMASSGIGAISLYGGQKVESTLAIANAGSVRAPIVTIIVNASMVLRDGSVVFEEERVVAQVIPFYQGLILVDEFPPGIVGQYEDITVPVRVFNAGLYIDAFQLNATAPEGFQATVTPQVFVPPQETRIVNVSIKTPKDKLFEFGAPATIFVNMRSVNDPGTTYTTVVSFMVRGGYLPSYWTPIGVLGLVCAGLVFDRYSQRREERVLEQGRPRRPRVTPRQQVLLKELKRRNPDAYKAQKAALAAVYAARRKEYKDKHKAHMRAERDERKQARVELKEEKKRRKLQRKREKADAKVQAKREAALLKERRKRMKVLEKEKAKLAKKQAKLTKKKDKADAKEAKRLGKEAAKKRKLLAKEQKKLAKAAKKKAKK